MLATGSEKLERMRDGRVVYIGAERVDDVTSHPAFRNGARTIAALHDLKADPAKRDLFTFEEDGERIGLQWLRCRSREDLARRMRAMKAIADASYGLIGRSPDHVAGRPARRARGRRRRRPWRSGVPFVRTAHGAVLLGGDVQRTDPAEYQLTRMSHGRRARPVGNSGVRKFDRVRQLVGETAQAAAQYYRHAWP